MLSLPGRHLRARMHSPRCAFSQTLGHVASSEQLQPTATEVMSKNTQSLSRFRPLSDSLKLPKNNASEFSYIADAHLH
jgi:hypothetical protein